MRGCENETSFTVMFEESGRAMLLDGEAQLQELSYEPGDRLARHDKASIAVFLRHGILPEHPSARAGHIPADRAIPISPPISAQNFKCAPNCSSRPGSGTSTLPKVGPGAPLTYIATMSLGLLALATSRGRRVDGSAGRHGH